MDITHIESIAQLSWSPEDAPESFEEAFRQALAMVRELESRFDGLGELENPSEVMAVFRWHPKDRVEWTIRVKPNSDFDAIRATIDRNSGRQGWYGPGEPTTQSARDIMKRLGAQMSRRVSRYLLAPLLTWMCICADELKTAKSNQ